MERTERLLIMADVPALVSSVANYVFKRLNMGGYIHNISRLIIPLDMWSQVEKMMLECAWNAFYAKFNPAMPGPDSATLESIKEYYSNFGRENETLTVNKNKKGYILKKSNLEYCIYASTKKRLKVRLNLSFQKMSGFHTEDIRMVADKLADVIRAFDSIVPQILKQKEILVQNFEKMKIEARKKHIMEMMRRQMMESMASEYLHPEDLYLAGYNFSEDGSMVHVQIKQLKLLEMDIPVATLAETLKDTTHLKDSMQVVHPSYDKTDNQEFLEIAVKDSTSRWPLLSGT